jgi:RNA chaperone Hfq
VSGKRQQLQHSSLYTLRSQRLAVAVCLVNRIKLRRHVLSFDQHVVLRENTPPRRACAHAISTLLPACIGNAPTTHASA